MSDTKPTKAEKTESKNRCDILKKAGRFVAVTAPPVTLLLGAMGKPKKAQAYTV